MTYTQAVREKMPEWPDDPPNEDDIGFDDYDWEGWHADRADAAIARLKVAVEAIKQLADDCDKAPDNDSSVSDPIRWSMAVFARRRLAAIGEVPE